MIASSTKLTLDFDTRPLIWIRLDNPHEPNIESVVIRALIDTGANCSVIPVEVCDALKHKFEDGTNPSAATGIGSGTIRTFAHATRITILSAGWHEAPDVDQIAFPPFDLQIDYVEQKLPFALFGQNDFLKLFAYSQNGKNGQFILEQI